MEIVGEAGNSEDAIRAVQELQLGIRLVDVSMPGDRSNHRSTSRMLSDMLGEGGLQSRIITAGGTSDMAATNAHAANDVVPET
jgi:DNA-binding NarL/FixJ family response regulator